MSVPTHTVACIDKVLVAPHAYELHLEKPEGFAFRAGQFVLFDVPLPDAPKDVQTRAYSVASSPNEDELLFIIKCYPTGRASTWVEHVVKQGTAIRMQGPFGNFILDRATELPYLFICTGTGIAPFRSHLLWALESERDTRNMDLIFGVVKKGDFFWLDWLKELERKHKNLTVHVSTLNNDPDWHGDTGSVQERVRKLVTDPTNVSAYLCGAPDMVREVRELCLSGIGMPKKNVHQEAFI